MALYAASATRRAWQVAADLGMVLWTIACTVAGIATYRVIDAIAGPARRTATTAAELETSLQGMEDRIAQVPALGDELAAPWRALGDGVARITAQAQAQADFIHQAALFIGATTAVVPILVVGAFWLWRRSRFVVQSRAAQRLLDADTTLDLFALRALAQLPLQQLATISDDPVGAWRRGDRAVIEQLAQREIHRVGLSVEPRRRPPTPPAQGELPR